uniref:ATP synthase complex subunit 8 n=1 Tax=Hoplistodera incisa TaxID=2575656 RepID=A0A4D6X041_9HEMI|nr:ATP synthase F0 subunit 8 [Hoplistodera incisa]QCI09199.1 ATP synthase F0 subunit 8 [Hoplistodera incisa]
MPQMAPLWWEILFIIFFMTFLIINIMVYFSMNKSMKIKTSDNKKSNQLNWTW